MLESLCDLDAIIKTSKHPKTIKESIEAIKNHLQKLGIANQEEIDKFLALKGENQAKLEAEQKKNEAIKELKEQINWSAISETFHEVKEQALHFKGLVIFLIVLAGFFYYIFTSGSSSVKAKDPKILQPVVAIETVYEIIVQKTGLPNGAILVNTNNKQKLMVLPRPGKVFSVLPGDQLILTGMPYKRDAEGTIIVKTIKLVRK